MEKKRMDFSFNLSSLAPYTEEVGGELIRRAILEGETAKHIKIQPGVKGTQAINLLDSTLVVQPGSCGWNSSGTTTYTQRDITVIDLKVNESLCPRDLNEYFLGKLLTPGSYNESVPFEEVISDLKRAQVSQYIENLMWSATSGSTGFSGFKELINSANTPSVITVSGAPISSTNGLDQIDALVSAIPDDIADATDLVVFMSHANYRKYLINFRNANFYHVAVGDAYEQMQVMHPNTNIKVTPVGGLNGSNKVVLAKSSYMVLGTDLLSDSESFKIFYSVDFDEVRFRCNFKLGVQIAWPQFFITNNQA